MSHNTLFMFTSSNPIICFLFKKFLNYSAFPNIGNPTFIWKFREIEVPELYGWKFGFIFGSVFDSGNQWTQLRTKRYHQMQLSQHECLILFMHVHVLQYLLLHNPIWRSECVGVASVVLLFHSFIPLFIKMWDLVRLF